MPMGEKSPDVQLEPPVVASASPAEATAQKPANGTDTRDTSPVLDIPNFALARMRVATGFKPFPDGIAWLKSRGYTTVLHIRAPGENDAATQQKFQNQNLRYLSLEVSPELLNRDLVEKFNRLVTDSANQPLFVYDQDGSLAGALWLLHIRLSEGVSEDKARLEAERLGFKPNGAGNFKAMSEAVNRYLHTQKP
jgi:protein tyrosine phosphatase (PTP) superfamily phosphohydrolase (DUF442 family)